MTFGSSFAKDWFPIYFGEIRNISLVKLCFYTESDIHGTPDNYSIEYEYWNEKQWTLVTETRRSHHLPVGNTANTVILYKIATS
jgi:hypothetical protein